MIRSTIPMAMTLLLLASCVGAQATIGPTVVASPTKMPVLGSEAPTLPPGLSVLPLAYVTSGCINDHRLAVVELATGQDFWTAFPQSAKAPELDEYTGPLVAVIYTDGWPGGLAGQPGSQPRSPAPGTWDICVETLDDSNTLMGTSWLVYGNIPWSGSPIAHP
jgi:hypothetical protein